MNIKVTVKVVGQANAVGLTSVEGIFSSVFAVFTVYFSVAWAA